MTTNTLLYASVYVFSLSGKKVKCLKQYLRSKIYTISYFRGKKNTGANTSSVSEASEYFQHMSYR